MNDSLQLGFLTKLTYKAIESAVKYGTPSHLDFLRLFIVKNGDAHSLIFLIKTLFRYNKNTECAEEEFFSMIKYGFYSFKILEDFRNSIYLSKITLIERLIDNGLTRQVVDYISQSIGDDKEEFDTVVLPYLLDLNVDIEIYLKILKSICEKDGSYFKIFLFESMRGDIQNIFENDILKNELFSHKLIVNYLQFLLDFSATRFILFEKEFISLAGARTILHLSSFFEKSNKRLILRRLVQLKDNVSLLSFIKMFPKYKALGILT